jgi:predicted amidohydrolase
MENGGLKNSIRLALVQSLGADIKDFRSTAERLSEKTEAACRQGVDLVLLPECAYPAYVIGLDEAGDSLKYVNFFLEKTAGLAKKYATCIVAGAAIPAGGRLYNSAVVFDAGGNMIGRADKSNLWHFDHKWFEAGKSSFVFDSPFGKIGVMVCADGRIPELARMLRLAGARLVLDAVNLVASARVPGELSNQQYRFMLQVRALENGVPIAVCDKAGVESNGVTFLGRSFVVSAKGEMIAQCGPADEETLVCDVELPDARPLFRKPQLYGLLTEKTQRLPITGIINAHYRLNDLEVYTAVARFAGAENYAAQAVKYIRLSLIMDARFIVMPPVFPDTAKDDILKLCQGALRAGAVAVLQAGEPGRREAYFFSENAILGVLHETHGGEDHPIQTVEIFPGCRASALFGEEMFIPEIARIAMLQGCDVLVWFDCGRRDFSGKLLQTRASENKIFTIRSAGNENDCSLIVNPDGAVVCTTYEEGNHYAAGMVYTALSKSKEVVPGTNIVNGRIPEFYKELIKG